MTLALYLFEQRRTVAEMRAQALSLAAAQGAGMLPDAVKAPAAKCTHERFDPVPGGGVKCLDCGEVGY